MRHVSGSWNEGLIGGGGTAPPPVDLVEFLLARVAEDEVAGDEAWTGEANALRDVITGCREQIAQDAPPAPDVYEGFLRQLGTRWDDHADYREEWRP